MDVVDLAGDEHRAYLVPISPGKPPQEGKAEPTRIEITGVASFTIGRGTTNDYVASDGTVSRLHCRIVCRDGDYLVQDLHSASGYRVESHDYSGRSGGWHFLLDGDDLYVGQFLFKFRREPARDTLEARLQRSHFARAVEILQQPPLRSLDAGKLRLLSNLLVHQQRFDEAEATLDRLSELEPGRSKEMSEYRACLRAERLLRARQKQDPWRVPERRSLLPPTAVPRDLDLRSVTGTLARSEHEAPQDFMDLRDLDDPASATLPCFRDGELFDVPFAHLRSLDLTRGRSALLPADPADYAMTYTKEPYSDAQDPTAERSAAHNRRWFPAKTLWYPAELVTLEGRTHYVFIPLLSAAHRPGDQHPQPSGSGDAAAKVLYSGERHFQVALADGFTSSGWPLRWIRRLTFGPLTQTN